MQILINFAILCREIINDQRLHAYFRQRASYEYASYQLASEIVVDNPQQAEQAHQEKLTEVFLSGIKSNMVEGSEVAAKAFALLSGETGLGGKRFDFSDMNQCLLDIAAHIKNLNAQINQRQSSTNVHSTLFSHKHERSAKPNMTGAKAAKTETRKSSLRTP